MTYIFYDHMIYLMPLNEHIGYGQIFLFLIAIQNVWYMIFLFLYAAASSASVSTACA